MRGARGGASSLGAGTCGRGATGVWAGGAAGRVLVAVLVALALLAGGVGGAALGAEKASSGAGDEAQATEVSYPPELGANRGFLPSEVGDASPRRVTIGRLASADVALDGQLVTFTGEVVGEPVRVGGDHRWVQVQSAGGSSYIMVLMTEEQASLIEHYGGYQVKGTTLRITGVYRVADPNQLGDIDVTAYEVTVSDPGEERVEPVKFRMLGVAGALVLLAVALFVVERVVRRRRA